MTRIGKALDQLVDEVMADHLQRLTVADHAPMEKRGPRPKKRPNTALISQAAAIKAARKVRAKLAA